MFIFNMKIDSKIIFKITFAILFIIILLMCGVGIYKVFLERKVTVNDEIKKSDVNIISSSNYTNILKEVHNNLDNYIGAKIRFTGFVYRLYDFTNEQFVLAREMIVSTDFQGVTVGFLCHLNGAEKYSDGCWVEVEGTITKGNYHGDIPVIEIYKIKETQTPSEEYVYPPDESYVATAEIL